MADENEFEPHLGRMRSAGGKRVRKYLGRVLAAANLARGGAALFGARRKGFTGSRIGRGAGVGRVLAGRGNRSAYGARRVILKASIVKLAGKGAGAAVAHIRYLQRDGTTQEGEPGQLYGRDDGAVDGKAFQERGSGDRHQFRFIVSAEDGVEYEDLKPLTRRLMARVEEDLGTKLDWVAVDHFNTGHPHAHIVVRGRDDRGADLVIARDYLTKGMRERASELVDLDLGPRSAHEIEAGMRAEVEQERLTSLDRSMLRDARAGIVSVARGEAFDQALRAGRLAKLRKLGLAEPIGGANWRLVPGMDETLRRLGERGDIIRTMQRAFSARAAPRARADLAIFDPAAAGGRSLVGRVVTRGLADEHHDRHYLIVDGVDGRSHFVAIGKGGSTDPRPENSVVRIVPLSAAPREVDRTVAAVATANGGHYDIDAHLRHDPMASQAFAEAHVRRLEAMRRAGAGVERSPSGRWTIAADHLERAEAYERRLLADRPVRVEMLSRRGLDAMVGADAATWLDGELTSSTPEPLRAVGFGQAVEDAKARRRLWLLDQGLAGETGSGVTFPTDMLETLRRRELLRVAGELGSELDKAFAEARSGARIEGIYRRSVDLYGGRFAVIERARDFTLVPWRPALERQLGKPVSGIMREAGVNWTFGRARGSPAIE